MLLQTLYLVSIAEIYGDDQIKNRSLLRVKHISADGKVCARYINLC